MTAAIREYDPQAETSARLNLAVRTILEWVDLNPHDSQQVDSDGHHINNRTQNVRKFYSESYPEVKPLMQQIQALQSEIEADPTYIRHKQELNVTLTNEVNFTPQPTDAPTAEAAIAGKGHDGRVIS